MRQGLGDRVEEGGSMTFFGLSSLMLDIKQAGKGKDYHGETENR